MSAPTHYLCHYKITKGYYEAKFSFDIPETWHKEDRLDNHCSSGFNFANYNVQ